MRKTEIQSLGEIAAASVAQPGVVARDVHQAVDSRVFGMLGPLGAPIRAIHDGVSKASYRAVEGAIEAPIRAGGRALASATTPGSRALADSTRVGLALGALNGIAGDRLADNHPGLALELSVRRRGADVALDAEGIAAAFPDATSKLVVFVHGLCGTDDAWRLFPLRAAQGQPPYGSRLREELGRTPIYVRYNTGLHVSDNGRRLADALDRINSNWPVEIDQIALVGHSMGGLVARSAAHYGELEEQEWTERLRHVFCLGTPNLGAPLERAAHVADWVLSRLPETRPFARMFLGGRSEGIKDMRYGNCIEEDWCDNDPDEFLRDRCREVPFLPSAAYYFIGATLSSRPEGVGAAVGDLLVQYPSASGNGKRRRIPFEIENGRHLGGLHHLQLLNHPDVYAQIRDWLQASP